MTDSAGGIEAASGRRQWNGDTRWGVRWSEPGTEDRCSEVGTEEQARSTYAYLTCRYEELGRVDRPVLIQARTVWEETPT